MFPCNKPCYGSLPTGRLQPRSGSQPALEDKDQMNQTLFRLSAAMAVSGLALGPVCANIAAAQSVTATATASTAPPLPGGGDPPSRVGRLARLTGTVSFHTADQDSWSPATANYPVTTGNSFWTEPSA